MNVREFFPFRKGFDQGVERVKLFYGKRIVLIGAGQVGPYPGYSKAVECPDGDQGRGSVRREKAAATHSGVDSNMSFHDTASGASELVEVFCLLHGVQTGKPLTGYDFLSLGRKRSPEEVDGSLDTSFGKTPRFANIGYAEKREVLLVQGVCYWFQPVAIGTGLDHSHYLLVTKVPGRPEIVPEGGKVDLSPGAGRAFGGSTHASDSRENGKLGKLTGSFRGVAARFSSAPIQETAAFPTPALRQG